MCRVQVVHHARSSWTRKLPMEDARLKTEFKGRLAAGIKEKMEAMYRQVEF